MKGGAVVWGLLLLVCGAVRPIRTQDAAPPAGQAVPNVTSSLSTSQTSDSITLIYTASEGQFDEYVFTLEPSDVNSSVVAERLRACASPGVAEYVRVALNETASIKAVAQAALGASRVAESSAAAQLMEAQEQVAYAEKNVSAAHAALSMAQDPERALLAQEGVNRTAAQVGVAQAALDAARRTVTAASLDKSATETRLEAAKVKEAKTAKRLDDMARTLSLEMAKLVNVSDAKAAAQARLEEVQRGLMFARDNVTAARKALEDVQAESVLAQAAVNDSETALQQARELVKECSCTLKKVQTALQAAQRAEEEAASDANDARAALEAAKNLEEQAAREVATIMETTAQDMMTAQRPLMKAAAAKSEAQMALYQAAQARQQAMIDVQAAQQEISVLEDRQSEAQVALTAAQTEAERQAAQETLALVERELQSAQTALQAALYTKATETAKKFQAEMDLETAKVAEAVAAKGAADVVEALAAQVNAAQGNLARSTAAIVVLQEALDNAELTLELARENLTAAQTDIVEAETKKMDAQTTVAVQQVTQLVADERLRNASNQLEAVRVALDEARVAEARHSEACLVASAEVEDAVAVADAMAVKTSRVMDELMSDGGSVEAALQEATAEKSAAEVALLVAQTALQKVQENVTNAEVYLNETVAAWEAASETVSNLTTAAAQAEAAWNRTAAFLNITQAALHAAHNATKNATRLRRAAQEELQNITRMWENLRDILNETESTLPQHHCTLISADVSKGNVTFSGLEPNTSYVIAAAVRKLGAISDAITVTAKTDALPLKIPNLVQQVNSSAGMNQSRGAQNGSVNQTQGSSVNHTQGSSVNQTHGLSVNQVNGSSVNQTQGSSDNQVNGSSVNQTQGSSVNQTQSSSVNQTQGSSVSQTQGSSVNKTHDLLVDQLNDSSVNQTHSTSVTNLSVNNFEETYQTDVPSQNKTQTASVNKTLDLSASISTDTNHTQSSTQLTQNTEANHIHNVSKVEVPIQVDGPTRVPLSSTPDFGETRTDANKSSLQASHTAVVTTDADTESEGAKSASAQATTARPRRTKNTSPSKSDSFPNDGNFSETLETVGAVTTQTPGVTAVEASGKVTTKASRGRKESGVSSNASGEETSGHQNLEETNNNKTANSSITNSQINSDNTPSSESAKSGHRVRPDKNVHSGNKMSSLIDMLDASERSTSSGEASTAEPFVSRGSPVSRVGAQPSSSPPPNTPGPAARGEFSGDMDTDSLGVTAVSTIKSSQIKSGSDDEKNEPEHGGGKSKPIARNFDDWWEPRRSKGSSRLPPTEQSSTGSPETGGPKKPKDLTKPSKPLVNEKEDKSSAKQSTSGLRPWSITLLVGGVLIVLVALAIFLAFRLKRSNRVNAYPVTSSEESLTYHTSNTIEPQLDDSIKTIDMFRSTTL